MISVEKCIFVARDVKCMKLVYFHLAYTNNEHPKSDEMPWLTWEESAKMLMENILNKEDEV